MSTAEPVASPSRFGLMHEGAVLPEGSVDDVLAAYDKLR